MATYFHGNSEIQAGPSADNGLQTLFLMNPTYAAGFSSDSRPSSNNFFLSPPINPHTPPPSQTQQFVGIPIPTTNSGFFHEIPVPHRVIPGSTETLWTPITRHDEEGELETPRTQRGLSLSLSDMKQRTVGGGEERKPSGMLLSPASSGEQVAGIIQNSVLISSKYLRAAQQLLEECVNVENGGGSSNKSEGGSKKMSGSKEAGESSEGRDGDAAAEHSGGETSVAERQEIQMKKAKLVVVLDELEQRYRQYHHQMQVVVSSFEQSAGIDSAKAYTALALKTISKQFRCLKDAILDQIGVANKSLGEEDGLAERFEGSRLKFVDSQLRQQRAIQQLGMIQNNAWRPQRGLPERSVSVLRAWLFEHFLNPYPKNSDKHMLAKQTGLSRSQVSNWFINARVRLWKPMVEEMYREEVKEQEQNNASDIKASTNERDNEDSTSKSQEKIHFTGIPSKSFTTKNHLEIPSSSTATLISTPPMASGSNCRNRGSFSLMGSSDLEGIAQSSPKRQRIETEMLHFTNGLSSISMDLQPNNEANNEHVLMTFGIEKQGRDGYPMIGGGQANFTGGYDSFSIGEMGRFDAEQFQQSFAGSGVSLTLGLPDRENFSMSGGGHQSFLRGQNIQLDRKMEMGETNDFGSLPNQTPQHSATAYDIQKQKRFVAQLLPDFVA